MGDGEVFASHGEGMDVFADKPCPCPCPCGFPCAYTALGGAGPLG